MTINVDPELGETLSLLEYRIQHSPLTEEEFHKQLGWEPGYFKRIFEDTKDLPLEHLLQALAILDLHPADFILDVYNRAAPSQPANYQEELHLDLVRLLSENLEVFGDRPSLPPFDRPPMANSRIVDHMLLNERSVAAVDGTKDLAIAARWMMTKLEPADRRMLVGLCERLGTFEAAIEAIPDLLAIVQTSAEVVWSMEHERLLMFKSWKRVEDVADDIQLEAVLLLLDLEIRAGLRDDLPEMVELREFLKAIQKGGGDVR